MPATDLLQRMDEGLIAIAAANTALQAAMGGTVRIVEPEEIPVTPRPMIALFSYLGTEAGGVGDSRFLFTQFTIVADDKATMNAVTEALENAITQPALQGQGLDACVYPGGRTRRRQPQPDGSQASRKLYTAILELKLWATK